MSYRKGSFVMNINQFNINNLYFSEPVNNNIIEDGTFYRLQYANEYISLNSVIIRLTIDNCHLIKYANKYKCIFNDSNNNILELLKTIEIKCLTKINSNKEPKYNLYEQIRNNCIKFFSQNKYSEYPEKIVINFKISGVWENNTNYGITYKCYDDANIF